MNGEATGSAGEEPDVIVRRILALVKLVAAVTALVGMILVALR